MGRLAPTCDRSLKQTCDCERKPEAQSILKPGFVTSVALLVLNEGILCQQEQTAQGEPREVCL